MENYGLAMQHSQHIVSVDNLEAKHTPTSLADLAIAKDDDLDYGPTKPAALLMLPTTFSRMTA